MTEPQTPRPLSIRDTPIPGFKVIDLPLHGDNRGWFKENWQRQKMLDLGLPDFGPVQNNISFNASPGVTRGIHAEPWDKYISVATGRVFGAWVDLREGDSFGATYWCEMDPSVAVFVPRGVGNAFQALEKNTAYTYLVNAHWSAEAQSEYTFLNLADKTASIPWPLDLNEGERSEKDLAHPTLENVTPMKPRRTLVIGATGQVGRALNEVWSDRSDVDIVGREVIDLADPASLDAVKWSAYTTVVNAAAYTAVDTAESSEGRAQAWAVNAAAPARLAKIASEYNLTFVHISTDYVFDGTQAVHTEDESFTPLGVYGQSKASGDYAVGTTPRHYILRTSWVIGEGSNFVKTMASLANRGVSPSVVDDQLGRLTFASEVARAIDHLIKVGAEYGTYNVTNSGEVLSWCDVAKRVFEFTGVGANRVSPTTTAEFFSGKQVVAPRPPKSAMDLRKLQSTGFKPMNQIEMLRSYLNYQQS